MGVDRQTDTVTAILHTLPRGGREGEITNKPLNQQSHITPWLLRCNKMKLTIMIMIMLIIIMMAIFFITSPSLQCCNVKASSQNSEHS